MNCPHCGMKETTDPTHHRVWACGSFKRWDTDSENNGLVQQSHACREIAAQKARADNAEERVRVLEEFRKDCAENWDCDTGANAAHHTHCRACNAIALTGGKEEE